MNMSTMSARLVTHARITGVTVFARTLNHAYVSGVDVCFGSELVHKLLMKELGMHTCMYVYIYMCTCRSICLFWF